MKRILKSLKLLSPNCREAVRLHSRSLDERLPVNARLGLRLHLCFCKHCRRFAGQTLFLRSALRCREEKQTGIFRHRLSEKSRAEMEARIRQELGKLF